MSRTRLALAMTLSLLCGWETNTVWQSRDRLGWHTVWTLLIVGTIAAAVGYWQYRRQRSQPLH